MKKTLLIIACVAFQLTIKAQNLTTADLPIEGEFWIEFKDTIGSNFTLTPPGAGLTWNYLNSFTVHDTGGFYFQLPNTAPFNVAALYQQASFVSSDIVQGDYLFVKNTANGMYWDGIYSTDGFDIAGHLINNLEFNPDLMIIPIPFQYGDVVQQTANFEYIFPDSTFGPDAFVKLTYHIFQDFETEAQGTLTTPLGTYPTTIRIKEMYTEGITYEVDSFATSNFQYLTDFAEPTKYRYRWMKQGPNCIVMTAEQDENGNVTAASYFTSGGTVGTQNLPTNNFEMWPNPAQMESSVQIKNTDANVHTIKVTDLSGRTVKSQLLENHNQTISISTSGLGSGIYLVTLFDANGLQLSVKKLAISNN